MNFNLSQFGRFVQRKANEKVAEVTGVNVMGDYYNARYTANSMGVDVTALNSSTPDKVVSVGGPKVGKDKDKDKKKDKKKEQGGHGSSDEGDAAQRGPPAEPQLSEEYPQPLILTVEDFLSRRDSAALTPHGGAVLFVHALLNYAQPATRAVGEQMLVLSMWEELLVPGAMYKTYALDSHHIHLLASQAAAPNDWAVRSLVAGAVPEHGYWINAEQVGVRFAPVEVPAGASEAQLLVWSSGGGPPRPITMRKNKKGFWKVVEFAALLAPVKPPMAPVHTAADDL